VRDFDPRKEYKPSRTQPEDGAQPAARRNNLDSLERFTVPKLRNKITCFKILPFNLSSFERGEVLPIVFVTITERSQAYLWVEDMALPPDFGSSAGRAEEDDPKSKYSGMTFSCIHTFNHPNYKMPMHKVGVFDVSFLTLDSTVNSSNYLPPEIDGQSRILDPTRLDHVQRWKVQMTQKLFDTMSEDLQATEASQDFVVLLCS